MLGRLRNAESRGLTNPLALLLICATIEAMGTGEANGARRRMGAEAQSMLFDIPGLPVVFGSLVCTGLILNEIRALKRK